MSFILPEGLEVDDVRRLLDTRARDELFGFMRFVHPLVSTDDFIEAPHLRAITFQLERLRRGDIRRLLVVVPPRFFKSFACSVAFPAWALGHDPTEKIVCVSYGSDLARDFAEHTRDIMMSPDYRRIFPNAALASRFPAWDKLETRAGGLRRATSIGGALTGRGADIVIIDDPMKAMDATSRFERDRIYDWLNATALTRLGKPAEGRAVVVMQRLHTDDIVGRLIAQGGWEQIVIPAEARTEIEYELRGGKFFCLSPGDLSFPERFSRTALDQLRNDLGEAVFNTQYLLAPTAPGGNLIKLKWFPRYEVLPHKSQIEMTYQVWDTALVDSDGADFSVGMTFKVSGKRIYLVDVIRRRMNYPELQKTVIDYRIKHNAKRVFVENAGSGIILRQNIRLLMNEPWLEGLDPKLSKQERANSQVPKMERGRLYLPVSAPWLEPLLDEVAAYPGGKHDDQVDALVYGLRIFDYGRRGVLYDLSMFAGVQPGESAL